MSAPTTRRSLLPLLHVSEHLTNRSHKTCQYRCGNQCAQEVPNTSGNTYFGDMVAAAVSRRSVLQGVAGAAVVTSVAWGTAEDAYAAPGRGNKGMAPFEPIAPTPADVDDLVVPEGYSWAPVISWGDPVEAGAPDFDVNNQTVESQKMQAGYNADYLAIHRGGAGNNGANKGLIIFNNEYTNPEVMFPGYDPVAGPTAEQAAIEMAAHGMTIVEVERQGQFSPWAYDRHGARNRRIHAWTQFHVDGPAGGAEWMKTSADPTGHMVLGTLNNCAGGETPWGTSLSGEENFNQYFNATGADDAQGKLKRYGITSAGRGWERAEDRFMVLTEPNEVNRFGWIVEVDPEDPTSMPVKHTALGRFKHEGATIRLAADGRAVAYMGDDERFDYIYKFVSRDTYVEGDKAHNMTLLSEGDLYVAKFEGDGLGDGEWDGVGTWIALVKDGASMVPGMSVAEVLTWTRMAADKMGPTKMDRPEDVQPNPHTGAVYVALTNNTRRTPAQIDEANPRASNKFGHVIEWVEAGNDAAALAFTWRIVLIAGVPSDPSTYFNGYDRSLVSPISCPDNVAFDEDPDHLWISTDGAPGTIGTCDGMFLMPTAGPDKGKVQQFLSVPTGAECCGPVVEWADRSILICVQHPGEDGHSAYPYLGDSVPRPGVAHVYRTAR
ncbi:PhoX family protein [Ornithinimicrobium tianjinense]|uniref:Phosphatase n=1 Tax=Ornithinimicrobium tianjinense TaxID=1195761 RepID=A0A917BQT5_9MICO|nr:PhoX family phosphatase [Ornithinimicrobium tianjinense]GGF55577.1 phosphatase [Ornithinimicrobium tianjinense]